MELITDAVWKKVYKIILDTPGIYAKQEELTRQFVEGVLWICRSGAQWRFLPGEYGEWNSVFKRFRRWAKNGVWERIFAVLREEADMEWAMIDSTIVRAHACSSGAKGGSR